MTKPPKTLQPKKDVRIKPWDKVERATKRRVERDSNKTCPTGVTIDELFEMVDELNEKQRRRIIDEQDTEIEEMIKEIVEVMYFMDVAKPGKSLAKKRFNHILTQALSKQREELLEKVEGMTTFELFEDRGSDTKFIHKGDVIKIIKGEK